MKKKLLTYALIGTLNAMNIPSAHGADLPNIRDEYSCIKAYQNVATSSEDEISQLKPWDEAGKIQEAIDSLYIGGFSKYGSPDECEMTNNRKKSSENLYMINFGDTIKNIRDRNCLDVRINSFLEENNISREDAHKLMPGDFIKLPTGCYK